MPPTGARRRGAAALRLSRARPALAALAALLVVLACAARDARAAGVESIWPRWGSVAGGRNVTVTGNGLGSVAQAHVCDTAADVLSASSLRVVLRTPALDAPADACSLVLRTVDGNTVVSMQSAYSFVQSSLTGVARDSGPQSGRQYLLVFGSYLALDVADVRSVTVAGVAASVVSVVSVDQLLVKTGAATALGSGAVCVDSVVAGLNCGAAYSYVADKAILGVSPDSLSQNGGGVASIMTSIASENAGNVYNVTFVVPSASAVPYAGLVLVASQLSLTAPTGGSLTIDATLPGCWQSSGDLGTCVSSVPTSVTVQVWSYSDGMISSTLSLVARAPVTAVAPSSGPRMGGVRVTISGSSLGSMADGSDIDRVVIGGTVATILTRSSTQVTVLQPSCAEACPSGLRTVGVRSASLGWTLGAAMFTVNPQSFVTSVDPPSGPLAGGNTVVISGANFGVGDVTSVTFGSTSALIMSSNSTTIVVIAPACTQLCTADPIQLVVHSTSFGDASAQYKYRPVGVINSVTPMRGPVAGDFDITVRGLFYDATIDSARLGSVVLRIVSQDANTVILHVEQCLADCGNALPLFLCSPELGCFSSTEAFTYTFPPTFLSITPPAGPLTGGNIVVLRGQRLSNNADVRYVRFGANTGSVLQQGEAYVAVLVPECSDCAPGMVNVTLASTTFGERSQPYYTYNPLPRVVSVVPALGRVSGGYVVTLYGTNLSVGAADVIVQVGPVSATIVSANDSQVVFEMPSCPTCQAGASSFALRSQTFGNIAVPFEFIAVPTITAVAPAVGPATGGTTVTITMSHWLVHADPPLGVSIGGAAATIVSTSVVTGAATSTGRIVVTTGACSNTVACAAGDVVVRLSDQDIVLAGGFYVAPTSMYLQSVVLDLSDSSDDLVLVLTFSEPFDPKTAASCAFLSTPTFLLMGGTGMQCVVLAANAIALVPGTAASFKIGDSIALATDASRALFSSDGQRMATGRLNIPQPLLSLAPQAHAMSMWPTVTACGRTHLSALTSTYLFGRAPTCQWSVLQGNPSMLQDTLNATNTLGLCSFYVAGEELMTGNYTFAVFVTNWLGFTSMQPGLVTFRSLGTPATQVRIEPSSGAVSFSMPLVLTAHFASSSCDPSYNPSATYHWSNGMTARTITVQPSRLSTDGTTLRLSVTGTAELEAAVSVASFTNTDQAWVSPSFGSSSVSVDGLVFASSAVSSAWRFNTSVGAPVPALSDRQPFAGIATYRVSQAGRTAWLVGERWESVTRSSGARVCRLGMTKLTQLSTRRSVRRAGGVELVLQTDVDVSLALEARYGSTSLSLALASTLESVDAETGVRTLTVRVPPAYMRQNAHFRAVAQGTGSAAAVSCDYSWDTGVMPNGGFVDTHSDKPGVLSLHFWGWSASSLMTLTAVSRTGRTLSSGMGYHLDVPVTESECDPTVHSSTTGTCVVDIAVRIESTPGQWLSVAVAATAVPLRLSNATASSLADLLADAHASGNVYLVAEIVQVALSSPTLLPALTPALVTTMFNDLSAALSQTASVDEAAAAVASLSSLLAAPASSGVAVQSWTAAAWSALTGLTALAQVGEDGLAASITPMWALMSTALSRTVPLEALDPMRSLEALRTAASLHASQIACGGSAAVVTTGFDVAISRDDAASPDLMFSGNRTVQLGIDRGECEAAALFSFASASGVRVVLSNLASSALAAALRGASNVVGLALPAMSTGTRSAARSAASSWAVVSVAFEPSATLVYDTCLVWRNSAWSDSACSFVAIDTASSLAKCNCSLTADEMSSSTTLVAVGARDAPAPGQDLALLAGLGGGLGGLAIVLGIVIAIVRRRRQLRRLEASSGAAVTGTELADRPGNYGKLDEEHDADDDGVATV